LLTGERLGCKVADKYPRRSSTTAGTALIVEISSNIR